MRSTPTEEAPSSYATKRMASVRGASELSDSGSERGIDDVAREANMAFRPASEESAVEMGDLPPPKPVSKQRFGTMATRSESARLNRKKEMVRVSRDAGSLEDGADGAHVPSRTDTIRSALADLHQAGALNEYDWKRFESTELLLSDLERLLLALETEPREQVIADVSLAMTLQERMPLLQSLLEESDWSDDPAPHR